MNTYWIILLGKIGYKSLLYTMALMIYSEHYSLTTKGYLLFHSVGILFSIMSSIPFDKNKEF